MTDEKLDTERVADALEHLADELEYQNAILTEQARAQHLTAVSANEYSEPDERARSAPNTRSLLTMIRDNESERERAENRCLVGDGGNPEHREVPGDFECECGATRRTTLGMNRHHELCPEAER